MGTIRFRIVPFFTIYTSQGINWFVLHAVVYLTHYDIEMQEIKAGDEVELKS